MKECAHKKANKTNNCYLRQAQNDLIYPSYLAYCPEHRAFLPLHHSFNFLRQEKFST